MFFVFFSFILCFLLLLFHAEARKMQTFRYKRLQYLGGEVRITPLCFVFSLLFTRLFFLLLLFTAGLFSSDLTGRVTNSLNGRNPLPAKKSSHLPNYLSTHFAPADGLTPPPPGDSVPIAFGLDVVEMKRRLFQNYSTIRIFFVDIDASIMPTGQMPSQ